MSPRIGLSSSSVFPEGTAAAFEMAARLGYDGVEVMVGTDSASQDLNAIRALRDRFQIPILAVHAPCLLVTQRVWGLEPWGKLQRAQEVSEVLGAATVVVHPPFRWQRDYARDFVTGIQRMADETAVRFAVENMYPWRAGRGQIAAYLPSWDIRDADYLHTTLDLSHTAVARTDGLQMARDLGDRLAHIHLADGTGSMRDEHLVPGRGTQPVAEVMQHLVQGGFTGDVVIEVSTRGRDRQTRENDLRESLDFARRHLEPAQPASP